MILCNMQALFKSGQLYHYTLFLGYSWKNSGNGESSQWAETWAVPKTIHIVWNKKWPDMQLLIPAHDELCFFFFFLKMMNSFFQWCFQIQKWLAVATRWRSKWWVFFFLRWWIHFFNGLSRSLLNSSSSALVQRE